MRAQLRHNIKLGFNLERVYICPGYQILNSTIIINQTYIIQEMADFLNQWTSETMTKLKPSDLFVFGHSIYRGIGHLSSNLKVSEGHLLAKFDSENLYIKSSPAQGEKAINEKQGEYLTVSLSEKILTDGINDALKRLQGHKLAQYVSMLPQLSWLVPYFKLKSFQSLIPSLVQEFNGESLFDVSVIKDISSDDVSVVSIEGGNLKASLKFAFELSIGGQAIRRISVNPLLTLSIASLASGFASLSINFDLLTLNSYTPDWQLLQQESIPSRKDSLLTLPSFYDFPLSHSCYGLSISTLSLTDHHISASFVPTPVEGICSPMYSRAFLTEFTRQMKQAEDNKRKEQKKVINDEL